jgi:hypothetical protein
MWRQYTSESDVSQNVIPLRPTFDWLAAIDDDMGKKNKDVISAITLLKTAISNFEADNLGACIESMLALASVLGRVNDNSKQGKLRNATKHLEQKREIIRIYRERYRGLKPDEAAEQIGLVLESTYNEAALKFRTISDLLRANNRYLKKINESSGPDSRKAVHEFCFVFTNTFMNAWAEKNNFTNQDELAEAVRVAVDNAVETQVMTLIDAELFSVK